MECDIREVGPGTFDESSRVIRAAFTTVADEFGFTPESNPTHGAFIQPARLEAEHAAGARMFGVFCGGRQLGFVLVKEQADGLFTLEKLAILPAYRHQGHGRRLLDHARDFVRQAGGAQLSIGIINESDRLKQWYAAYGFVETERKRFAHLPFTVCYMALKV